MVRNHLPTVAAVNLDPNGKDSTVRIGILGTGTLAAALAEGWLRAGHDVVIAGRSAEKAAALARQLDERVGARMRAGTTVRAGTPAEAVTGTDAVLLAVDWTGVPDMVALAGGGLAGSVLIDPTNPVEHGVGVVTVPGGGSAAERIAELAPGARVVKAFHLFPSTQWVDPPAGAPVTVALCGDDPAALEVVGELVRAVGGVPAVLGGLGRARQLEEVAGFVIGLAFAGVDPNSAVPKVTGV
jgi:NADPH-dependent F420 reductase